jgi:hypothetical protein
LCSEEITRQNVPNKTNLQNLRIIFIFCYGLQSLVRVLVDGVSMAGRDHFENGLEAPQGSNSSGLAPTAARGSLSLRS